MDPLDELIQQHAGSNMLNLRGVYGTGKGKRHGGSEQRSEVEKGRIRGGTAGGREEREARKERMKRRRLSELIIGKGRGNLAHGQKFSKTDTAVAVAYFLLQL